MTTRRKKRCVKCKEILDVSCFGIDKSKKDGLNCWCKECKRLFQNNGTKGKHGPRNGNGNAIMYRVTYDPCDSFGVCSEFTRTEIFEMMREDYLAIGTTFKRNRDSTYHKVAVSNATGELKLEML